MRTEQEIIGDLIAMVRADRFGNLISGSVYRDGMRPRNSDKEDMTIILTSVDGNYQIQNGDITILCYVPDIQPYSNGVYVKNGFRIAELEYVAKTFAESLTCEVSNYRFTLSRLVSIPIDEIHQHAISLQLSFQYACSDNDEQSVLITEDGDLLVTGCAYLSEEEAQIELNV